jgi:histidine triad (HIT) family protein
MSPSPALIGSGFGRIEDGPNWKRADIQLAAPPAHRQAGDFVPARRGISLVPVSDVICQIVSGALGAAVVAREEEVIAFLDHRPVFKGHVLVAPTRHVENLLSLPSNLMVPLLTMAQRVAAAIGAALGAQGTFVAINNVVSQSIPHLHVHVVPRTKGDGLRGFFWPRTHYAAGEIETYAKLISEALPETAQVMWHAGPDPGRDS